MEQKLSIPESRDATKQERGIFMLKGKTVVLAVSGSIAAYKIASLASALKKLHANVQVLMTKKRG